MEQIRSFIAIELPDGLKLELSQLVSRLKSTNQPWVKWVDPDGIHLTLKFLGNIAAGQVDAVTKGITEAARMVPPFRLKVEGLGVFPNPRRVQVVWVGITGDIDKLSQLQKNIETCVAPLGFPTEARPFSPHLTLARVRDGVSLEDRQKSGQLIVETEFRAATAIEVKAVNLMRSQLTRGGAIYSQISEVKLK